MPKKNVLRPLALAILLVLAAAPARAAGRAEPRPVAVPALADVLQAARRALIRLWEGIVPGSLAAASGTEETGLTPSGTGETHEDKGVDIDPNG